MATTMNNTSTNDNTPSTPQGSVSPPAPTTNTETPLPAPKSEKDLNLFDRLQAEIVSLRTENAALKKENAAHRRCAPFTVLRERQLDTAHERIHDLTHVLGIQRAQISALANETDGLRRVNAEAHEAAQRRLLVAGELSARVEEAEKECARLREGKWRALTEGEELKDELARAGERVRGLKRVVERLEGEVRVARKWRAVVAQGGLSVME